MRRNCKNGIAAARPQLTQIIKALQLRHFFSTHIEHNDVCAVQAHLGSWNKQNPHGRRISEYFRSIKDGIVQGDGKDAKTKCTSALQQLMRGVIHRVLGIIKRVNVQVELDPFFGLPRALAHAGPRSLIGNQRDFILIVTIELSWKSLFTCDRDYEREEDQKDTCQPVRTAESFVAPTSKARVVEWQTRTFEGRMPKGMRVQVPPRAPDRAIKLFVRLPIARLGLYRLRIPFAFPRNHEPSRQGTLCLPNSKDRQETTGWCAHDCQDQAFGS